MIGVADELKKLADLQEQGVLSGQEFEEQKAKLLGGDGADVGPANAEEEPAIESTDTESQASPFQQWGFALLALCFVVGIMVGRHWTSAEAVASDPASDWLAERAGSTDQPSSSASAETTPTSTPSKAPMTAPSPSIAARTPPVAVPTPPVAVPTPPVAAPTPPVAAPRPAVAAPTPAPAKAAPSNPEQIWRVTVRDVDAQLGPKNAPATVVLFSNFENATSKSFAPNVRRLVKEFGKKVRVVFKHKVIPASPEAIQASEAALAAGQQKKFWEFHDALAATTSPLSQATFEQVAKDVGLNVGRFKKALASGRFRAQVLQDSLLANGLGAHSMPNILVNGVRTRGEKSYEVMKALVEKQLANRSKGKSYDDIVATGKIFEQLGPSVGGFDTEGSATLGKAGARVQVVVFEDFQ